MIILSLHLRTRGSSSEEKASIRGTRRVAGDRTPPSVALTRCLFEGLGDITDELEPAFTIRNGTKSTTVVISSWEMAKECFTSNDQALSGRPFTRIDKYLGYNYS